MARKMIEQLTDDLDGTILDAGTGETMTFTVDGRSYEMDLSTENAATFRDVLAPYVKVARSASSSKTGRSRSTRSSGQQRRGYDLAIIRAWAQDNGLEVPARGRVSNKVIDAFNAAH